MSSSFFHQSAEEARSSPEQAPRAWGELSSQNAALPYSYSTSPQLNQHVLSLQAKQGHLKSRLTTLLNQQLQESFGYSSVHRSASPLPSSLDMMIFGLREELERVNELLLSLQQK